MSAVSPAAVRVRAATTGSRTVPDAAAGGRNLARVAAGAVLVVVCAALTLAALQSVDHRRPVLVVVRPVAPGQILSADDVAVTRVVVGAGALTVPAADLSRVIGQRAVFGLVPGSVLNPGAVQAGPGPSADQVTMGLSVKPGLVPRSVRAGDRVLLFVVADPASPDAAAPPGAPVVATVTSVEEPSTSSGDGSTGLDVLVGRGAAPAIAAAGSAGRVVVAVAP